MQFDKAKGLIEFHPFRDLCFFDANHLIDVEVFVKKDEIGKIWRPESEISIFVNSEITERQTMEGLDKKFSLYLL
jgi:hypothetical protein